MDVLYALPEPEDLQRDECSASFHSLRDEIKKLQDKFGAAAAPALKEVELLVKKYETLLSEEARQSKLEKQVLQKYKSIDQSSISKAQNIVRAFLKRKRFTALASQFLSSPTAKELGKRNDIWREVLVTEKTYFQNLVILYEIYVKPLKMKAFSSHDRILTDKQIQKIFQNIEDIKNTAKALWKKLEDSCRNWPEITPKVGAIFLAIIPEFKGFYVPYCKGIADALKNLAKLRKKSHVFSEYLDRTASDAAGNSSEAPMPVSQLLMLPIYRMQHYDSSLRELMSLTPSDHVDYPTLLKASREIGNIYHESVPSRLEAQKLQRLFNINNTMKGTSVLLTKDVRAFIREGPLVIVSEKKVKRGYVYMFTDSIVVSEINEGTEDKSFEQMITLAGSEVREINDPQLQTPHMFCIVRENRKTMFSAATFEEKRSWMVDLTTIITASINTPGGKRTQHSAPTSLSSRDLVSRTASTGSGGGNFSTGGADMGSSSAGSASGPQTPTRLGGSEPPAAGSVSAQGFMSPRTKKGKMSGLIHSEGFSRALERQHANKSLEDFIDIVPAKVKLIKLSHKECIVKFNGPLEGETESEKFTTFASAKSVSTYPMMARKNARDGDPIADHYGLAAWHNRVLATVADGCSWGVRAQQAAARAVDTNLSDFTESKVYLSDLREVAMELLKSVAHVHDSIAQGKKVVWDAGTTTLLSGVLVEIEPTPQLNNANWAFVCVNVGDCKAFLWSKSTHQVTDITAGNRLAISDPKDPGGRLGPYIYQGAPDLRNMNFFYTPCALDDLLILCSDGLHDNLDPELNGISPKELAGLVANYQNRTSIKPDQLTSKWEQLDPVKADALKSLYRTTLLEKLIGELDSPPNPRHVTKVLIGWCNKNTRAAREFLEQNNDTQLPPDHHLYPGKLDHTTVLCVQLTKSGFGNEEIVAVQIAAANSLEQQTNCPKRLEVRIDSQY